MRLADIALPRPRRRSPITAGVAAVILGVAAGWLAGGLGGEAPEPTPPSVAAVTIGPASFGRPASWEPADGPPGTRAFAAAPGLPARVLVAFSPRLDPSLVPPALRDAIGSELGRPRGAGLGGLAAWTYGPVDAGRTTAQVTVAATTRGVFGVACTAPAETWNVALDCHAAIDRISIAGARSLRPADDLAFRRGLQPVMAGLDARRVRDRAALRRSATRAGAARRLAAAHADAAARLSPLATSGAATALVAAIRRDALAYRRFARATAGRPSRAGVRARAQLLTTEAALRRALRPFGAR